MDEWLLCGPAELVGAARATLADRGVVPAHIHRELFHVGPVAPRRQAEQADTAGAAAIPVIMDGRASTFPLRPDTQPILVATLQVRVDAPYACKNGMCGTCRAKLVTGTVEMDHNYALEEKSWRQGSCWPARRTRPAPRSPLTSTPDWSHRHPTPAGAVNAY